MGTANQKTTLDNTQKRKSNLNTTLKENHQITKERKRGGRKKHLQKANPEQNGNRDKNRYKRQGRALYNEQGISTRRCNNFKYTCTQHRSTLIHKANTDGCESQ